MAFLTTALGMALCFSLASSHIVLPDHDFKNEMFTGKWYHTGMATNGPHMTPYKAYWIIGVLQVTKEDGGLGLSYEILHDDGSCSRDYNLAKYTDSPGRFNYTDFLNFQNDMVVLNMAEDHAVIHLVQGSVDPIVSLYDRSLEANPEAEKDFKMHAAKYGILSENTVIFNKQHGGECPKK